MEEQKVVDLAQPQISKDFGTAQWQWQSGSDPWKEKDATKWTWQAYSDDDCLIIEKAFSLGKEAVNLKEYEIDLKKKLQVHRTFKNRVRRIRRQKNSRFMMEMPEPTIIVNNQKTMNQAFGTIQHFLDYIMKRTPEAYRLYQRLKNLFVDCNRAKFEDIIQEVIGCIEKGAEVREKIIKTRSGSQTTDFINEAKQIVDVIDKSSTILSDFLKAILKVYTMETFVCYWLNELLRSEDWQEINVLTPYLVCLVYTFKLSEYIIKCEEPQGMLSNLLGLVIKQKLYLYRGAALTKEQLANYNLSKIKYFSWNGVTSTSRSKPVALNFIRMSLAKAQKLNESKVGVLFSIETDFASAEDCEGMIDTLQNSCSQYPDEQEVILAPGTVFKLRNAKQIESEIYEVSLIIKKKFNETKENLALLGNLQDQAISKDKAMIDGLPSQESFRLLELLRGNKLIRKLEIRNSGVEEHIMEEIENLRITTNIKKENIRLVGNTIVVSSLSLLTYHFSQETLSDICMLNKIRFKEKIAKEDKEWEIKDFILREGALQRFRHHNQLKDLWEKVKNEDQITKLDISMKTITISDDEFEIFLECLKELKFLRSLKLTLNTNRLGSKENFKRLCQTIGSLTTLAQLSLTLITSDEGLNCIKIALWSLVSLRDLALEFGESREISDHGLNHLKQALTMLTFLRTLSLSFRCCKWISDEGLNHLRSALTSMISLQNLSLHFGICGEISDKGLNHLKSALTALKSLQLLSLNFEACFKLSDEGINHLKSALLSLTSLQNLFLDFRFCYKITDEGLLHLQSALASLSSLQNLSLDFRINSLLLTKNNFSDEGLKHLKNALTSLTSLRNLSLNFEHYEIISNEGLNHLKHALTPLRSLQYLSLDFAYCYKISDEGLNHLKDAFALLTSLQDLSLRFKWCMKITDEGLNHLKSALIPLTSMQNLSLDFHKCETISVEGLNHLKIAVTLLTSLQTLSLRFKRCDKISDEGLNHLKNAFLSLTSLQNLSLHFGSCEEISDEGLNHLKIALISLTSLQNLSLNFNCCRISDKGLKYLKDAFKPLISLQSLSLNFGCLSKISDEGLEHLKSALMPLRSLQNLSLNLGGCGKISGGGLGHLKKAFTLLTSLQNLSLDFGWCKKMSDEGLKHLMDAFPSLISLQNLSLNLKWDDKISDEGLNYLKNILIPLASLQDLSLDFMNCTKISDEGLRHLKDALPLLKSLQNFSLDLSKCDKISDKGLDHLKNALIPLTSLQSLSINHYGCEKLTSVEKLRFRNKFLAIPNLYVPE